MPTVEPRTRPFCSAIILAAGASTRMGRLKQLLPLDNKPLLQHVVEAARASCVDEVIVVLGHGAEEIRRALRLPPSGKVRIVLNPDYVAGQSTSLRVGLAAVNPRANAVAILLGDQPGVTADLIDTVAAAFQASNCPIARPVHTYADGSRAPGHPVFLARRIWPEIENLRGDEGARTLMRTHPEMVQQVALETAPSADVDTPADYDRAIDAVRARKIRE